MKDFKLWRANHPATSIAFQDEIHVSSFFSGSTSEIKAKQNPCKILIWNMDKKYFLSWPTEFIVQCIKKLHAN